MSSTNCPVQSVLYKRACVRANVSFDDDDDNDVAWMMMEVTLTVFLK